MEAQARLFDDGPPDVTITQSAPTGQPVTRTFMVAGLQHRASQGYLAKLCIGNPVDLVREPGNTHDRNAIQVRHYGRHIGYAPAPIARELAPLIDFGYEVTRPFIDLLTPGDVPAKWLVRVIVKLVPPAGGVK